jgi:hypothetical protein
MFERLTVVDPEADESALVERIAALERLKSTAAAGQARAAAALDAARRAAEAAAGMPAAKRGRGLASEVALARRDSPAGGGQHLGLATALVHEMPHTLAALETGALSEWRATLIVRWSACLDVEDRRTLDAEMCAELAGLDGLGDAKIAAAAKTIAYRLDPHAVVDRAVRAESERTVTIRPAPDTMTYVTALLPMTHGVSVYTALRREADTCFDGRGRGQIMADTLVERITGRPAEVPGPIAVDLVITDESLLASSTDPARIATTTTPCQAGATVRPARRMGSASVNAATTPRKHPAGRSPPPVTTRAATPPNSPHPPAPTTTPPHHHYPAR